MLFISTLPCNDQFSANDTKIIVFINYHWTVYGTNNKALIKRNTHVLYEQANTCAWQCNLFHLMALFWHNVDKSFAVLFEISRNCRVSNFFLSLNYKQELSRLTCLHNYWNSADVVTPADLLWWKIKPLNQNIEWPVHTLWKKIGTMKKSEYGPIFIYRRRRHLLVFIYLCRQVYSYESVGL